MLGKAIHLVHFTEGDRTVSEKSMKHPWQNFRLTKVGNVADVVRGGGGKLSPVEGDPGEALKVPGGDIGG